MSLQENFYENNELRKSYPRLGDLNPDKKNQQYTYSYSLSSKIHNIIYLFKRVWNNKKARYILIISVFLLKAIGFLTMLLIIPLIGDSRELTDPAGLKGIFETVKSFIVNLLPGA